jgi:hypothetical protein
MYTIPEHPVPTSVGAVLRRSVGIKDQEPAEESEVPERYQRRVGPQKAGERYTSQRKVDYSLGLYNSPSPGPVQDRPLDSRYPSESAMKRPPSHGYHKSDGRGPDITYAEWNEANSSEKTFVSQRLADGVDPVQAMAELRMQRLTAERDSMLAQRWVLSQATNRGVPVDVVEAEIHRLSVSTAMSQNVDYDTAKTRVLTLLMRGDK